VQHPTPQTLEALAIKVQTGHAGAWDEVAPTKILLRGIPMPFALVCGDRFCSRFGVGF
jgi:hypothetical protein